MSTNDLFITERQLQMVQLLARGYNVREVAEELNIAPRTVKYRLEQIRLQLGRIPTRQVPEALHERGYPIYPR